MQFKDIYDVIVIGGGHAGVEATLAAARMGRKTLLLTLNLEAVSFMACNPSIGGTAKGHLVREIDALGGQMGISADDTLLQLKMLNIGKGAAVQSLRCQSDKKKYHDYMVHVLLSEKNVSIKQEEAVEILTDDGKIIGVSTSLKNDYGAKAIVVCTGVYLKSRIIIGDHTENAGPSGFLPANSLTESLEKLGFSIRRFKTGTPARVSARSIDFSKFEIQKGDDDIYMFSFMHDMKPINALPCYLGYTTAKTKEIILANLSRSPLYGGVIKGVGPRYCPSIEDKIVRFADKERHQIFLEPEDATAEVLYVQGMSSSLPSDVQDEMYRSIPGFENVEIIKYAYAIEYDAIDPTDLDLSLQFKKIQGLFTAGQINGSSGYEEAAAQGLIAGINAARYVSHKEKFVLNRSNSYIGVLIDDLVTKGTNEPYRMMTARAEHRLYLRQDNADIRLTKLSYDVGLATNERLDKCNALQIELEEAKKELKAGVSPKLVNDYLKEIGETEIANGSTFEAVLKRPKAKASDLKERFGILQNASPLTLLRLETAVKYEGYLIKEQQEIEKAKKLEEKALSPDLDYSKILGLRLEARAKLNKIKPQNLGQASRISGVSPADISVLMLYLKG